jgi:hypothetical protein
MFVLVESTTFDGEGLYSVETPWPPVELDGQDRYWPFESYTHARRTGDLAMECALRQSLYGPKADPLVDKPLWTNDFRLTARTEVLPDEAPDTITLTPDRQLHTTLQRQLTAERVDIECTGLFLWRTCHASLWLHLYGGMSMDLAFSASLLAGDREYELSPVSWAKGETGWAYAVGRVDSDAIPERVQPILRASRDVAAGTVGCFDVWDGELRLSSVTVGQ